MADFRSPLAKARDNWMESKEGKECTDRGILSSPRLTQYLENRIQMAFVAGANWAEKHGAEPVSESEGLDLEAAIRAILIEVRNASNALHDSQRWSETDGEDGMCYWDSIEAAEVIALSIARRLRAGAEGGDVGRAPEALRKAFMEGAEWFHNRIDGQPYPSQEEAEKFAEEMFPAQPPKPIAVTLDHALRQIQCCLDGGPVNAPYEVFRALESALSEWLGQA